MKPATTRLPPPSSESTSLPALTLEHRALPADALTRLDVYGYCGRRRINIRVHKLDDSGKATKGDWRSGFGVYWTTSRSNLWGKTWGCRQLTEADALAFAQTKLEALSAWAVRS